MLSSSVQELRAQTATTTTTAATIGMAEEPAVSEAAPPTTPISGGGIDNFTNDSAMMIAWERSLEVRKF